MFTVYDPASTDTCFCIKQPVRTFTSCVQAAVTASFLWTNQRNDVEIFLLNQSLTTLAKDVKIFVLGCDFLSYQISVQLLLWINPTHKHQHNTTQHNTTQHNTTQHNTTQHNTTQHNTTQHNTTTLSLQPYM